MGDANQQTKPEIDIFPKLAPLKQKEKKVKKFDPFLLPPLFLISFLFSSSFLVFFLVGFRLGTVLLLNSNGSAAQGCAGG